MNTNMNYQNKREDYFAIILIILSTFAIDMLHNVKQKGNTYLSPITLKQFSNNNSKDQMQLTLQYHQNPFYDF